MTPKLPAAISLLAERVSLATAFRRLPAGDRATETVTLYDNFSSGREWHYEHHSKD